MKHWPQFDVPLTFDGFSQTASAPRLQNRLPETVDPAGRVTLENSVISKFPTKLAELRATRLEPLRTRLRNNEGFDWKVPASVATLFFSSLILPLILSLVKSAELLSRSRIANCETPSIVLVLPKADAKLLALRASTPRWVPRTVLSSRNMKEPFVSRIPV